jgi:hypothetical protein
VLDGDGRVRGESLDDAVNGNVFEAGHDWLNFLWTISGHTK